MKPNPHTVKDELLKAYPKKTARKRAEQIVVNERRADGTVPEIKANVRTTPGAITQRGCTYAGCKGVVIGPTRDILSITHGPIGCGFYSWLTRRNQTRPESPEDANYITTAEHRHAGRADRLRRGEETAGGDRRGLRAVPSQGDRHLLHLSGRTDRRRRARRGARHEGEARHQRLRLQLRRIQGRQPVGRPSHRQQPALQARGRNQRNAAAGEVQDQHAGRVQHRRRRVRHRRPAGALRHHADIHLQRQLHLRCLRQLAHGGSQRGDVPPVDQLRGRDDGKEVRHPVDQGELRGRRRHRQVAAPHRAVLQRRRADRAGGARSSPTR
jgi:hypothetical protein